MANKVEIQVVATDAASGIFDNITSRLGGLGDVINDLGKGKWADALISGFDLVVDYTQDAIDKAVEYNDKIREISRLSEDSLEDVSRLIQAAGDLGIEYSDLATGLQNATKNGVDVSIDSLLDLADQYDDLKTPIEKAKLLTDTFGAKGPEMAVLFEQGRDRIVVAMDDVSESLVWDEEKQAAFTEYESSVGELTGKFEELKIEVGTNVIPLLNDVLDIMLNKESRGTGYQRMLEETTADSWALVEALKEAWKWLQNVAGGPSGGHVTSAGAIGIGGVSGGNGWDTTGGGPGGASGLNFVVPPGYPNDSYPIRVQSGEHVQVTPKNQVGQGSGGQSFDYYRFARIIAEELQKVSR